MQLRKIINDYEASGRFKAPSQLELLAELNEIIIDILIASNSTEYFKSSGVVSQLFKAKMYDDKRIVALIKLRETEDYRQANPREQYQQKIAKIKGVDSSFFEKNFINKNPNVEKFLTAIINQDLVSLQDIQKTIRPEQDGLINLFKFLGKPVDRHSRLFKKEQAMAAAKWWLGILKNDIPKIIAIQQSFRKKNKDWEKIKEGKIIIPPINFTDLQEREFLTYMSDTVWEICQDARLNVKGQSPLYVGVNYAKEAMKAAGIEIEGMESIEAGLIAFVCQDGKVTFQNGSSLGDIYNVDKEIDETKLPSDEVIHYRDLLSTVLTGKMGIAATNILSLPFELLKIVLILAKPPKLDEKRANNLMIWNQERLSSAGFFRKETQDPVLKVNFERLLHQNKM